MNKKLLYHLPVVAFALLAVISIAQPAFAQGTDLDKLKLPVFGGDFFKAFAALFNIFLLIAGIVAFLFVLYGGFLYLTAGGDTARTGQGRSFIINALIGIIIIFISYAVVNFLVGRIRSDTKDELKISLNH